MDYRVEFRALLHEGTRYGWLKTDCPNNKYVACTGRKAFENMTILSWCSKLTINKGFSDFKVRSFTFLPFRVTTAQKTESFESIFWLTSMNCYRFLRLLNFPFPICFMCSFNTLSTMKAGTKWFPGVPWAALHGCGPVEWIQRTLIEVQEDNKAWFPVATDSLPLILQWLHR